MVPRRAFLEMAAVAMAAGPQAARGTGSRTGVVNVLDHGARADGRTDDGPAVEAALATLAPTGGTLLFPGVYAGDFQVRQGHVCLYAYGAVFNGSLTLGDDRRRFSYIGLMGGRVGGRLMVLNTDNSALRDVQAHGGLVLRAGADGWCALTVLDNLVVSNPRGTGLAVLEGAKFLRIGSVYVMAYDGQRPVGAYFEDCLVTGLTIEPVADPGTGRSTALPNRVSGTRTIGTLTTWDVGFDFSGAWENQYTLLGVGGGAAPLVRHWETTTSSPSCRWLAATIGASNAGGWCSREPAWRRALRSRMASAGVRNPSW